MPEKDPLEELRALNCSGGRKAGTGTEKQGAMGGARTGVALFAPSTERPTCLVPPVTSNRLEEA